MRKSNKYIVLISILSAVMFITISMGSALGSINLSVVDSGNSSIESKDESNSEAFVRDATEADYESEPSGTDGGSTGTGHAGIGIEDIGISDVGEISNGNELIIDNGDEGGDVSDAIRLYFRNEPEGDDYDYAVEIDVSQDRTLLIEENKVVFEIPLDDDWRYNIKSNIYIVFEDEDDKDCFTAGGLPHFTELGVDEKIEVEKTIGAVIGAFNLLRPATMAPAVFAAAVCALLYLVIGWITDIGERLEFIASAFDWVIENWQDIRDNIEMALENFKEFIKSVVVSYFYTYSLETEGSMEFELPSLKGTLESSCVAEGNQKDIYIKLVAQSGVLTDIKRVKVHLTNDGNNGDDGDNSCFLAGTRITMADGSYKNIEDIEIDDMVKSYDAATGALVDAKVTKVCHHTPEEMTEYYVVINDGIRVTPNHLLYINGEFIPAGEAQEGDILIGGGGDGTSIGSVEQVFNQVPTYNFEVSTDGGLTSSSNYIISSASGSSSPEIEEVPASKPASFGQQNSSLQNNDLNSLLNDLYNAIQNYQSYATQGQNNYNNV